MQEELWKEVHSERRKRRRGDVQTEVCVTSDSYPVSLLAAERRKARSQQKRVDSNPTSGEEADYGRVLTTEKTAGESVTDQKQQTGKARKRQRKRKREGTEQSEVLLGSQESQKSTSGTVEVLGSTEEHSDSLDSDTEENGQPSGASIAELFQEELECAKMRLQSSSQSMPDQRPSFGHRAGFDAFMTGYAFAFFVLRQLDASHLDGSVVRSMEAMLAGLAGMRNKLANRSKIPLQITKSHFTRTSVGHRKAWNRTAELFGGAVVNPLTVEKK